MRKRILATALVTWFVLTSAAAAAPPHNLISRETPGGIVVGYQDTPKLPWTGNKYHVHDPDRPIPPAVTPAGGGQPLSPPSDAIVLFDGQDLSHWQPTGWKLGDGFVEVAGNDSLETRESFGDCQLHLEWATPSAPAASFMNRGNSGVLLMGRYELQIFDSWVGHRRQIYPDGQAASIYGQTPPQVNVCRKPGAWQTYDLVFIAPRFDGQQLVRPARLTLLHNGVLVHHDQDIRGPMAHRTIVPYEPHAAELPLVLQGHRSPVRFRNIWIRPLRD
jgi:hypothetical protein